SVTKTTVGQAQSTATAAERLSALPETEAAARAGGLSGTELESITDAATADPTSERELLETAATNGVRRLREHAARVKANACTDEVAREAKIRRDRSLRHWTDPDGVAHLHAHGPVVEIDRVMTALAAFERTIFDDARTRNLHEPACAYAFDALVAMADATRNPHNTGNTGAGGGKTAPQYVGVVRIDHAAYKRGYTNAGEVCEVVGVGPIPVFEASRLLDDAFLKAVVVKGTDVTRVSHLGRLIPAHLRSAIAEQYQECCIRGCHDKRHLEIDHNIPVEHGGRTELHNLSRLCTYHHRHKHQHNYRLAGDSTDKHFVTVDGQSPENRPPPGQGP
ncbi:MAG: HNH endonuclease signature motif containing protein, partial [Acidimicrobiia bacterium]